MVKRTFVNKIAKTADKSNTLTNHLLLSNSFVFVNLGKLLKAKHESTRR